MASTHPDWDQRFDDAEFTYGTTPNAFLTALGHHYIRPRGRVLSLGEGEGRNAVWLARRGFRVTAVDCASIGLQKLGHLAADAGVRVETHRDDVATYAPEPVRWDAIILLHIHLDQEVRRRAHRRIARGLRPGGVLLLEALRPEQLDQPTSGPTTIRRLYSAEDLRLDFAPFLQIRLLRDEDRCIDAGVHRGPTSVVQLIARRPG